MKSHFDIKSIEFYCLLFSFSFLSLFFITFFVAFAALRLSLVFSFFFPFHSSFLLPFTFCNQFHLSSILKTHFITTIKDCDAREFFPAMLSWSIFLIYLCNRSLKTRRDGGTVAGICFLSGETMHNGRGNDHKRCQSHLLFKVIH